MNDAGRMFLMVTMVTVVCGALLGAMRELTGERIVQQQIRYVKGPAIRRVLAGVENDPVQDRRTVEVQDRDVTVFNGKMDGTITAVALETVGVGYGGDLSVITAFHVLTGECKGVAIATSKETPGIGTKVDDGSFTEQFKKLPLTKKAAVSQDGGTINGISGATISSRAVCSAVARAQETYTWILTNSEREQP